MKRFLKSIKRSKYKLIISNNNWAIKEKEEAGKQVSSKQERSIEIYSGYIFTHQRNSNNKENVELTTN